MLYWRGSGRVRFLRGRFDGLLVSPLLLHSNEGIDATIPNQLSQSSGR